MDWSAAQTSEEGRIAFWINAYNESLREMLESRPMRRSVLLELRRFRAPATEVAGRAFSLDQIEHGLLRRNARPPGRLRRTLARGDPRLDMGPRHLDPRIHFALNCGARSCPPIRSYDAAGLEEQLELATRSYLEQETEFEGGRLRLPGLMRLYRADFGSRVEQVEFAAARLPALAEVGAAAADLRVAYRRFDWRAAPPAELTGTRWRG